MKLEIFKVCWNWIKNLPPDATKMLCFILIIMLMLCYTTREIKDVFRELVNDELIEKLKRENYTVEITPKVNLYIRNIISKDSMASNVILLNYHNTLLSSHGLSYRYLTAICELFQGFDSKPCSEYWKELEYMNYGEEIYKINIASCIIISNISELRNNFPKFTYLLERSEFKSAVLCPIEGVDGTVGMLIIGYKKDNIVITDEYIRKVITPNILPLSTLLDYNYVNRVKMDYEN